MSIKKNLINASIVLAVFIGLNSVVVARNPNFNTDSTGAYIISNLSDLEKLSDYVNDVYSVATQPPVWTSSGKTFILTNNIYGFSKPIGTATRPFLGTFNGSGYQITLSINSNTDGYCGVFGHTRNAKISDLISAGEINYSNANSTSYIGGIVGFGEYTSIMNCDNRVKINVNGVNGTAYVGGIVACGSYGHGNNSTINCTNHGAINVKNISDTSYVGGIVAYGTTAVRDSITDCANLADISVSNVNYNNLGGIIGYALRLPIVNCENLGTVTSTGACVGGLVGYGIGGKLSNCTNTGTTKGQKEVGGLVGCSQIYNITDCANAGWIHGNSEIGGLIGSLRGLVSMLYCLNTGVVQGTTNTYALIGLRYNNYLLTNKVSHCFYDNQMAPYNAIQGMTNPLSVHSLSTNELTKPIVKDALGDAWTIYPDPFIIKNPPNNQVYSYPILFECFYTNFLAAIPARLAASDRWNSVSSTINLDNGYYYNYYEWPPTVSFGMTLIPHGPGGVPINYVPPHYVLNWQSNKLNVSNGVVSSPLGYYYKSVSNPNSYRDMSELKLTVFDRNSGSIYGYRHHKTIPISTTGIPFKLNINEYEMYGFETSEVSPNIVTNNAVIDISSAIEGYLNVAVFDMSGAKVMNVIDKYVATQSQTQIELNNLNSLSNGSYMVAISLGNNVVFRRFIKQ